MFLVYFLMRLVLALVTIIGDVLYCYIQKPWLNRFNQWLVSVILISWGVYTVYIMSGHMSSC